MLILIARFLAAGTAVLIAGIIAKKLGPFPAGLILAFPFVIGTGLIFAAIENDNSMRTVALGSLLGLIPLAAFLTTILTTPQTWTTWTTLTLATLAWLTTAALIYYGKALLP